MAHFVKPPGSSADSYDADNKLAPGSLLRVRIPSGSTRTVALWGGDGLDVRSNNPNVVPQNRMKELPSVGQLRIFELYSANPGGSYIDVWGPDGSFWIRLQAFVMETDANKSCTSAAQLVWMGVRLKTLPDDAILAFTKGILQGAKKRLGDGESIRQLESTINGDPLGFYWGYCVGLLSCLVTGLKNLVETIKDLFKISIELLPMVAVIINPSLLITKAVLMLSDTAEMEIRKKQLQTAKRIAQAAASLIVDIVRNPDSYVLFVETIGTFLGDSVAVWFSQDLAKRPAKDIGQTLGSIVGQVLFEIILQLLIAAATEGAENVAELGVVAGDGTRVASRLGRLIEVLKPILKQSKVFNRVMKILAPLRRAESALAEFSAVERGIIKDVRAILRSPELAQIRRAQALGEEAIVTIGTRVIQYEPGMAASGMTMFGENGFVIGRQAFASEEELVKTLLHETFRLETSAIGRGRAQVRKASLRKQMRLSPSLNVLFRLSPEESDLTPQSASNADRRLSLSVHGNHLKRMVFPQCQTKAFKPKGAPMRWSDATWREITSSQFNAATDPRSANMKNPVGLIVHWTGTTLSTDGAWNWFNTPPSQRSGGTKLSSAHFIIDRDGTATQCINTDCRAFSVDGDVIDGSRVSLELVATPGTPEATDDQIVVCGDLLRWLNRSKGVPLTLAKTNTDRGLSWHNLYRATACPGPEIKKQLSGDHRICEIGNDYRTDHVQLMLDALIGLLRRKDRQWAFADASLVLNRTWRIDRLDHCDSCITSRVTPVQRRSSTLWQLSQIAIFRNVQYDVAPDLNDARALQEPL